MLQLTPQEWQTLRSYPIEDQEKLLRAFAEKYRDVDQQPETARERNIRKTAENQRKRLSAAKNINTEQYRYELSRIDWDRRNACKQSFLLDLKTYNAAAFKHFKLRMADVQLEAIRTIEDVVLGRIVQPVAFAFSRGSGKSSLILAAQDWCLRHGHARWPIWVCAETDFYLKSLSDWKAPYESPYDEQELLTVDYPELCYPARQIAKVTQNARLLHHDNQLLAFCWGTDEIILPTSPQSIEYGNAGGIVAGGGLLSAMRGAKRRDAQTNEIIRPDLVFADDIETDSSSTSPTQIKKRLEILSAAVGGMAGPGETLRLFLAGTVLAEGCAIDQLLGDSRPEWLSIRRPMLESMPTNMQLWDEFGTLLKTAWLEKRHPQEALDFYAANQSEMDAGAKHYWPDRIDEPWPTAICSAMVLHIKDPTMFASEYQNKPLQRQTIADHLAYASKEQILAKMSTFERGQIPDECTHVVSFADVQHDCFFWLVMAVEPGLRCYVIDYGAWPEQDAIWFQKSSLRKKLSETFKTQAEAWSLGLQTLFEFLRRKHYAKPDGTRLHITRGLVDATEGAATDVLVRCCREHGEGVWLPSFASGRTTKPINERLFEGKTRRKYVAHGPHWNEQRGENRVNVVRFDSNFYKTRAHRFLLNPATSEGSVCLYVPSVTNEHALLASHLTDGEYPEEWEGPDRKLTIWKKKLPRMDQDWFACLSGALVAASMEKLWLSDEQELHQRPGHRSRRTFGKKDVPS